MLFSPQHVFINVVLTYAGFSWLAANEFTYIYIYIERERDIMYLIYARCSNILSQL